MRCWAFFVFDLEPEDKQGDRGNTKRLRNLRVAVQASPMTRQERYLHFDNIDMEKPDISSRCSHCGQEFRAEPKPDERVDNVLLRIRESSTLTNADPEYASG